MKIEIVTEDKTLAKEIEEAHRNPHENLPNGILLGALVKDTDRLHGVGLPETISFVLGIGASVSINLLSSWLYDKVKNARKLKVEGNEVKLSLQEIHTALEEYLREKRS